MNRVGHIAVSGLSAAAARLTRSAQNVANVNTNGYMPVSPITQPQTSGGVTTKNASSPPFPTYNSSGQTLGASGTDLAQETVEQIGAMNAFKANLAVIKTEDEMQRTLLDIKA
jgi:flagellar basal-body rod protein FlgC